ncbi:DUF2334 domain-containing protein [Thiobacter aerophilum]|uniref:DUF2334 domain-containing protein n=1 Tax=Thiobacter aerophilum TaxID=3121275 RepID=A0ABV0EFS7_9BURK
MMTLVAMTMVVFSGGVWGAAFPTVSIVLRYDDYAATSSTALEQRLFTAFAAQRVPVLVAVVPFPGRAYPQSVTDLTPIAPDLSEEKVTLLKALLRSGIGEIGLHGYSHRNNGSAGDVVTEFAGLPFERQRQFLLLGRRALESTLDAPVRVFTPPFNAFDAKTVRALRETGFSVLSAGTTPAQEAGPLRLLPGTVYPQGLRAAVARARQLKEPALVVVVMHPYDFVDSGEAMPGFRTRYRDQMKVQTFLDDV